MSRNINNNDNYYYPEVIRVQNKNGTKGTAAKRRPL